ncbi:bifunctional DedA family/phosphatase PAP2 family protein [Limibacillus halophilus]
MVNEVIGSISDFLALHPHWIGIAIFTATTLESMAFVGSFFPGMSIVIALSGVAASLGLNIWFLVLWCALGAIVGDGVSYWIGHRHGDHIKSMWPFASRPELLRRGTEFFERRGAMSIVVGRFLPFTRAVVPIVAGMLGMAPGRFYAANILSAIAWALLNVLPAAGVGLAFVVINESGSRLAIMLGSILAVFLIALASGHLMERVVIPTLARLLQSLGSYLNTLARDGGTWNRVGSFLLLPTTVASLLWVMATLCLFIGFAGVLEDIVTGDPLVRADVALNALFEGYRNPLGDKIMILITTMGDSIVVLAGFIALLVALLYFRAWRTALLVLALALTTSIFVPLLKWTLHKPRPIDLYSGAEAFSFPSGHAAFSAVLCGLVAVVASYRMPGNRRAVIWAIALTLSVLIGFSRIYLSAHWPSDVIAGLLFGWAMVTIFGVLEETDREPGLRHGLVGAAAVSVILVAWGAHAALSYQDNVGRYAMKETVVTSTLPHWSEGGWTDLPKARIDLVGEYEEPFILQAAVPVADVVDALEPQGWRREPTMQLRQAAALFNGVKDLGRLPALPLLHNGALASLTMVKAGSGDNKRSVLRAWDAGVELNDQPGNPPVLLVSVTEETVSHPFFSMNLLRDVAAAPSVAEEVLSQFRSSGFREFETHDGRSGRPPLFAPGSP